MREIKFRAWDKKKKNVFLVNDIEWGKTDEIIYVCGNGFEFCVRNIELMQFTGLFDKNGKAIYEGDVLEMLYSCHPSNKHTKSIEVVEWGINGWNWSLGDEAKVSGSIKNIEVIGNIYENPELLEDKK